jgi:hypothetical protein
MALSGDHGVAPLPSIATQLHLSGTAINADQQRTAVNKALSAKFTAGRNTEFVKEWDYPVAWLNNDAFLAAKIKEADAERAVGDALIQTGLRSYFTRTQLAAGEIPNTPLGREYLNSYSPQGAWYVLGVPPPFSVGSLTGTDHASPYTYDRSVPLAFYGLPFQSGTYRTHVEPVDIVSTFSSLLGIIMPTHAVGRVLVEALTGGRRVETPVAPADHTKPTSSPADMRPAALIVPAEASR